MNDYKLDELGWREFEKLIQTVVKAQLGFGIEAWGGSGDWGCDAYFAGKLRYPSKEEAHGPFVFQCKFVENANAAGAKPGKLLTGAVQKECAKIRENLKSGKWNKAPNCYGLFTNAPCKPQLRKTLRTSLNKVLLGAHISIHDCGDVCRWLSPEIVQYFPQLHSPPKLISTQGMKNILDMHSKLVDIKNAVQSVVTLSQGPDFHRVRHENAMIALIKLLEFNKLLEKRKIFLDERLAEETAVYVTKLYRLVWKFTKEMNLAASPDPRTKYGSEIEVWTRHCNLFEKELVPVWQSVERQLRRLVDA